jgi:hypothetical protein
MMDAFHRARNIIEADLIKTRQHGQFLIRGEMSLASSAK